jgi:hypothetical protein
MTLEAGVDERYIMRGRSSITGHLLTTSRIHPASKELSSYPVYLTSGRLPILTLIFTCAVEVSKDSSHRLLTNTTAPAEVSFVSKQRPSIWIGTLDHMNHLAGTCSVNSWSSHLESYA